MYRKVFSLCTNVVFLFEKKTFSFCFQAISLFLHLKGFWRGR